MPDIEETTNSILLSVKKFLGIASDDQSFDADIIMHINSVFSILYQLGVGSAPSFQIEDESTSWDEFFSQVDFDTSLPMVKSFMYTKVRMLFDPPSSNAVAEAMNAHNSELEWRLNVSSDPWEDTNDNI